MQEIVAIAFVGLLLAGALFVLRRKGAIAFGISGTNDHAAAIVRRGRLQLTPQHSLHWIRAGNRELLIAVHPSGCTVLLEDPQK